MKNNKNVKVMCGLLVLVLLTTCVISSTLARYTTGDTASDTARVAKWGVEVSASGTLFGNAYADTIVATDDSTATVVSSNTDAVVAPGTTNTTGFQIKIKGQPEVDFEVSATASNIKDIYLKAATYGVMLEQFGLNASSDVVGLYTKSGDTYTEVTSGAWVSGTTYYKLVDKAALANDYYPIVWTGTLTQNSTTYPATEYTSLASAANGLADFINGFADGNTTDGKSVYQANHDLDDTYKLTWAWAFDVNDAADTILGNLMANNGNVVVLIGTDYVTLTVTNGVVAVGGAEYGNLILNCDIEVTATQID